jgi:hypothetical protein
MTPKTKKVNISSAYITKLQREKRLQIKRASSPLDALLF